MKLDLKTCACTLLPLVIAAAPAAAQQSSATTSWDFINGRPAPPVDAPKNVLGGPPTGEANDVYINFDGGTQGVPIRGTYAGSGVTFSNASWYPPILNQDNTPSEFEFLVDETDDGFNPPFSPSANTPIVGVFTTAVDTVSILAFDVGDAGAEMRVYDATSGGNLLGSDSFFGTGAGVGIFTTLTVSAPGIRRFELFQPQPTVGDGVGFDNLEFSDRASCGTIYCDTNPDNAADIAIDTCDCAAGNINLSMSSAPVNQFGYLLISAANGTVTDPPGAQGDLCLIGASIGRYTLDAGVTDGAGNLNTDILNAVSGGGGGGIPNPPGGNVCNPPGQSWNFQYWHRDGMQPSKFSKAIAVTFQ